MLVETLFKIGTYEGIKKLITDKNINKIFVKLCKYDRINIIKKIIHRVTDRTYGYYKCIKYNHYELTKYMSTKVPTFYINCGFIIGCRHNCLKIIKWLCHNYKIDIHFDNEGAFVGACYNGHLDMVKYLISLESIYEKINIHIFDEVAFKYSCLNGHLNLVKYLISLDTSHGKINIHPVFPDLCRDDTLLPIIKYLISLESTYGKINIHVNAFKNSCEKYCRNIIIYLLSLQSTHGQIDINQRLCKYCCELNDIDIIENICKLRNYKWELDKDLNIVSSLNDLSLRS